MAVLTETVDQQLNFGEGIPTGMPPMGFSDQTNAQETSLPHQQPQGEQHGDLLLFLESPPVNSLPSNTHEIPINEIKSNDNSSHPSSRPIPNQTNEPDKTGNDEDDDADDEDEWLLPPPPTTRRYTSFPSASGWWQNPSVSTPLRQQQSQPPSPALISIPFYRQGSCRQRKQQRRRGDYHHEETMNDITMRRPWWIWNRHRHAKKILFGSAPMNMSTSQQYHNSSLLLLSPPAATTTMNQMNQNDKVNDDNEHNDDSSYYQYHKHSHTSRRGCHVWWFWQDDDDDEDDEFHDDRPAPATSSTSATSSYSAHNMALALAFTCTSIATTVPMTLIPTMARDFYLSSSSSSSAATTNSNMTSFVSSLTSQAVSYAVLGTACGKFLTGWLVDVVGARRMSRIFSIGLGLSLCSLAMAPSTSWALVACFGVEFFQAIQWPSFLVILATHHPPDEQEPQQQHYDQQQQDGESVGPREQADLLQSSIQRDDCNKSHIKENQDENKLLYEQGIYITSLTSRLGSLLIIPFCSWYLQRYHHDWRPLALGAAMLAWLGSILCTYWIQDAPGQWHQLQNPMQPRLVQDLSSALHRVQQRALAWAGHHCCQNHGNQRTAVSPPRAQLDLLDLSHDASIASGGGGGDAWSKHAGLDMNRSLNSSYDGHSQHLGHAIGLRQAMINLVRSLLLTHLLPSLRHVVTSGIFWMIAVAHVGGSLVRTSDRILATYFVDTFAHWSQSATTTTAYSSSVTATTPFHLTQELASACSVSLSIGMMLGLTAAGSLFQAYHHQERRRKRLVTRLYLVTIASCYLLALLSLPPPPASSSHHWWRWPTLSTANSNYNNNAQLIFIFQVMVSVAMGFGIAVPYYQIPSLVIADYFGHVKGLASSYMDGVAYGLSSVVWHIVGATVANPEDDHTSTSSDRGGYSWMTASGNGVSGSSTTTSNSHNMGWAYGWSAVALMVIVSAVTMVEFMEHYFVRKSGRHGGTYETILLA